MIAEKTRCPWARSPAMIAYHDAEWGRPIRDDRKLFELLALEGVAAGLSWEIALARREHYRRAFANFDIALVAAFTDADVERLMSDTGIIRNRQKLTAVIGNAKAALAVRAEFGSLSKYFWRFVGGKPLVRYPEAIGSLLEATPVVNEIATDLRARGFRFIGPKTIYSFMQAAGLLADHVEDCFLAKA